ncbi:MULTISPECIES: hypothetical protein [unclassified Rhodococcus (in: high G+C Gram-positive bacteria)]|uniref:hypothetical protein n=1 Tax=Rhodococcus sp. SJ-3 TaxID=3454628 RepID=UPI003F7AC17A
MEPEPYDESARSLAADAESAEDAVEPYDESERVLSVDSAASPDAAAPKLASERVLSVDSVAELAEVLEKNPLVMVCSLSIGTFGCR